jgi:hypothetical protein
MLLHLTAPLLSPVLMPRRLSCMLSVAKRLTALVQKLPNGGIPRIHRVKQQVMEYPDPWADHKGSQDSGEEQPQRRVPQAVKKLQQQRQARKTGGTCGACG